MYSQLYWVSNGIYPPRDQNRPVFQDKLISSLVFFEFGEISPLDINVSVQDKLILDTSIKNYQIEYSIRPHSRQDKPISVRIWPILSPVERVLLGFRLDIDIEPLTLP